MDAAARHEAVAQEAERAVINMRRSLAALGSSAAAVTVPVSVQMARGVQATENAWRELEAEFGLLTAGEIADLMGSRARSRARTGYATDRRRAGKLIGIKRRNAFLYPGFQFDRSDGTVLPVIPELLQVANKYGKTPEGLAQWLCARTGQLDEQRPVDHLHGADRVIEAAENHYGIEW